MDAYRQVLQAPGAKALLALGFVARIPFSTLGLLLTLHCVLHLDRTYLDAGLIVTASTLGTAISSPWRGRLVDRHGLRRALIPSIIIQPITLVAAAFANYQVLVLLALVGGLFAIPVWTIVRTSLSVIVPANLRRSAFALDAVFTEVVFMAGPAAITVIAIAIGTAPTLLIVAGFVVLAGVGLAIADPPTRSEQVMLPTKLPPTLAASESGVLATSEGYAEARVAEDLATGQIPVVMFEEGPTARRALLTMGGIAILAATVIGNMAITATDLGIVAILNSDGKQGLIGFVMAVWCFGSLVGGFVYGAMTRTVGPLWVLLALGLLTIPVAFATQLVALLIAVFLAGVALAPLVTATGEAISHRVPEASRGEAMGWHGSAMTIGAAVGSPLFGAVIDEFGAQAGVGSSGVVAAVAAVVALIGQRLWRARRRRMLRERFGD